MSVSGKQTCTSKRVWFAATVHSRIDASNAIFTSIFPEEVIVDMQPASLLHALNVMVFYRQEEAVLIRG